jgi:membrane peptidoglycan carboxypeptidase
MPIPDTPRSIPSLKLFLFRAFSELQGIENQVFGYNWPNELSEIEKAVVILEDRRFFRHSGVDWRSIVREFYMLLTFRKHGGASTIEMQFVRTCTGYKEITFRRKLFEIYMAWALSHRVGKLEVLRSYMKIAFFGSHITGVDQASLKVFGMYPDYLNTEQATVIASMLVYPRPLEETEKWILNIRRRSAYGQRLLTTNRDRYWK